MAIVHDRERNRWRVVTEFDPMMMSLALERGNDSRMIEYIADEVKHMVMEQLTSCNIQRPEDLRLGRMPY